MGRRSGYGSFVTAMARAGRQMESRRDKPSASNADLKEHNSDNRETMLARKKNKSGMYLEEQEEQVTELNIELKERVLSLCKILEHTLDIDDTIVFESLKQREKFPEFKPPVFNENPPPAPSFLQRILPGSKVNHDRAKQNWQECASTKQIAQEDLELVTGKIAEIIVIHGRLELANKFIGTPEQSGIGAFEQVQLHLFGAVSRKITAQPNLIAFDRTSKNNLSGVK